MGKLTKKALQECVDVKQIMKLVEAEDPNTQLENLKKVSNFLSTILNTEVYPKMKKIEEATNFKQCSSCKKYFEFDKKTSKEEDWEEIIRNECVYTDAGYGDDDRYAAIRYFVRYEKCPYCNKKNCVDKIYLGQVPGTEKKSLGTSIFIIFRKKLKRFFYIFFQRSFYETFYCNRHAKRFLHRKSCKSCGGGYYSKNSIQIEGSKRAWR